MHTAKLRTCEHDEDGSQTLCRCGCVDVPVPASMYQCQAQSSVNVIQRPGTLRPTNPAALVLPSRHSISRSECGRHWKMPQVTAFPHAAANAAMPISPSKTFTGHPCNSNAGQHKSANYKDARPNRNS